MATKYFQIFNEDPDDKKEGIFYQIVVEVLKILNLPSSSLGISNLSNEIDKIENSDENTIYALSKFFLFNSLRFISIKNKISYI